MSELERFKKDVQECETMQGEVKGLGNDLAKIVAYANSKGYEFSADEVSATGELSEEQLESVAGGFVIGAIVA